MSANTILIIGLVCIIAALAVGWVLQRRKPDVADKIASGLDSAAKRAVQQAKDVAKKL